MRSLNEGLPEQRLRFEALGFDLSARLVAVPLDQLESEIHTALKLIMEFFQVDQCSLLIVSKDRTFAKVTHFTNGPGLVSAPEEINLAEVFPWSFELLGQGKPICISQLEDYPENALRDRQTHAAMGLQLAWNFPLTGGSRILRLTAFRDLSSRQAWSSACLPRLHLLGDIIVGALERAQDKLKLEEQLRFEMLLTDISARFVNLPAERINNFIEVAQCRICELLELDRATLWQVLEQEPGAIYMTHIHQPAGSMPPPARMNGMEFFPWTIKKVLGGETAIISDLNCLPPEAIRDRESFAAYGSKSFVAVPLSVGGGAIFGLVSFAVMHQERVWPETVVNGFKLVAQVFANALARKHLEEEITKNLEEIKELKLRLEKENTYLQEEINLLVEHTDIIGQSAAINKILIQAEQVAQTDSTVLLLGETGTGKGLLARAIHRMSLRKDRPLVTVNCAALPPTLIESELFGREKGAYTGALTRMLGRFELADGSTLFLDEIGELPLEIQSKLLRFLEEGSFERVGSSKSLHVNVRIISATNRDLAQEVKSGKFRRDLFYRLNVFPIVIPPIRERPEDIPLLVWSVVKEYQVKMGKQIEDIPKQTMQALQAYSWPGNVRELRNLLEHAMIVCRGKTLHVTVPKSATLEADDTMNLEEMERMHILGVLEKSGWRIDGPCGAAEMLGLHRTTLQSKMKRLGIRRSNESMTR